MSSDDLVGEGPNGTRVTLVEPKVGHPAVPTGNGFQRILAATRDDDLVTRPVQGGGETFTDTAASACDEDGVAR
jgi:hypothetical protein